MNPAQKLSILLVDDEPDNLVVLTDRLKETTGWDLFIAKSTNATEAIEALKSRYFDIVFVDYRLPDVDGIKLLEQIRQLHPKAAVVVTSAVGSERVAVEAMKRGAIDYLTREDVARADLGKLLRRAVEMQILQSENLELRQVNRMKDEFISSASHELRTPLAVILGYTRALEDGDLGPLNEGQIKALQAIRKRGDKLLEMVNRLLTFKESTFNAQEVLLRPTELRSYIDEFIETSWSAITQRDIKITRPENGDALWVMADQDHLKDAFSNLLSNAVKFSPDSATVTVELSQHNGREVWLKVIDQGRGIPPEHLPRLFDGFVHTDSDLTREVFGLGLGLALTRQIVEVHGGRVWLDSGGNDLGTTATIALPLSEPDSPHVVVEHRRKQDKRRVLIVEDNDDILEIVRMFVAGFSSNLELTTAGTGAQALEAIGERHFDLVMLDIILPDMSGSDVLTRVKKLPEDRQPPVLILSGHSEAARRAVRQGATDYLIKPFSRQAFLDKIVRLIGLEKRSKARK